MEFPTFPLHEAAVRLHYRLIVIDPWPKGNGRHSRLIADVMIAVSQSEELTWGSRRNLGAIGDARRCHIEAIKKADAGDFVQLLAFAQS